MLEIVARLDPLRAAERRVVKVHPHSGDVPIVEHHRRLRARVEAGVRFARAIAFDVVQDAEDPIGVRHAVNLAADAAVRGRYGCRIDPEIEERPANPAAALRLELRLDAFAPRPPEAAHQSAVET